MRERFLQYLAQVSAHHPYRILLLSMLVTLLALASAEQLKLSMHFKDLMPAEHPLVIEFQNILDDYQSASMIIVAAKGEEKQLKRFVEELAPKIEALDQYVQRVDYKIPDGFLRKHAFMLQKPKDLKNSLPIYEDISVLPLLTHINDNFEKTYVYDGESINSLEKENNAIYFLDGIEYWLKTMYEYTQGKPGSEPVAHAAVDRFLLGDPYMISPDKDMILLFAMPTFTVDDVEMVIRAENTIDSLIAETSLAYPVITAGTTGTMALARDETVAASQDMYLTSLIAFAVIIALFIISFRMWVAPVLAGITLIIGVVWSAGLATVTVGSLNIFTSMFAVILIGLGVDFSIHIITVFTEKRAAGMKTDAALSAALLKSGKGVITGGFTTAFAFLTLIVSSTEGMKEFGIVAGSGVVLCMLATLLVLPALLSARERILARWIGKKAPHTTDFRLLGTTGEKLAKRPGATLIVAGVLTVFLLWQAAQIEFDYNYLNMEPVGLTSIKLQDEMIAEFNVTPDFAIVTTRSIEESRRIASRAKELKLTGMVNSISEYLPSEQEQNERRPWLQEIRRLLIQNKKIKPLTHIERADLIAELERLEANVIEFAQLAYVGGQEKVDRKCAQITGDPDSESRQSLIGAISDRIEKETDKSLTGLNSFQGDYFDYFKNTALQMAGNENITLNEIPADIKDQFVNRNGDKFLVTIYPKEQVWNLRFLETFTRQMWELDQRITGIPPVFYHLIQIITKDGKIAFSLTTLIVFLLLLIDFRRLRPALLALIPLVVGAVWMVGIMRLFGLQLTMLNVMGIPLIIGIGIDDGVHILHRYLSEGKGSVRTVMQSTGKAVLLTSLTTMLAFGSLVFATYRGLGSLGLALFIGVGACFLTSIVILPAMIGWFERIDQKGAA